MKPTFPLEIPRYMADNCAPDEGDSIPSLMPSTVATCPQPFVGNNRRCLALTALR